MSHVGQCFCGAVTIEVSGQPAQMGYCHCASCRAWSASPVNAFSLWPAEAVTVTQGSDHIANFAKTSFSQRRYCTKCGGHVMNHHPSLGLTDVSPALVPGLEFRPAVHLNYAETVLPMADGLPKFRDFPTEVGGSGELIAESN
jgi:hypothetical protein